MRIDRLRHIAALAAAFVGAMQGSALAAENRDAALANPVTYYDCGMAAFYHSLFARDPAVAANRKAEADSLQQRGIRLAIGKGVPRETVLAEYRAASERKGTFLQQNRTAIPSELSACAALGLVSAFGDTPPPAVAGMPPPPPPAGTARAPAASADFAIVPAPPSSRGVTAPLPGSDSGGISFIDERGWYQFILAEGGTTRTDGNARLFEFPSGGQRVICSFVALPMDNLAKFSFGQIQAELDSLYAVFEPGIAVDGKTVLARQKLTLGSNASPGTAPVSILGWDMREANGMAMVYGVAPFPAGYLVTACGGSANSHHREVLERYLRVGEGALIPGK